MRKKYLTSESSLRARRAKQSLAIFSFFSFLFFSSGSFAQDVVEVETDIGMDQLQETSNTVKPGIKPRASYKEPAKTDKAKAKSSARQEAIDAQMDGLKTDTEEIKSEISENSLPVRASEPVPIKVPENALTDVQVVEISASLRNLIEENENLKQELDKLDEQLKTVRGQQKLDSNRMNEVALERDALRKQNENIVALGKEAQQNLTRVQQQLAEKEQEYSVQIIRLQTELADALRSRPAASADVIATEDEMSEGVPSPSGRGRGANTKQSPSENSGRSVSVDIASTPSGLSGEELKQKSEKVLMALDTVAQEKAKLTRDEAKLHYNMGNTYFNQGDYQRAAKEYGLAVKLAPEDANAHYNLAFVNGEFLNDPVLALEHYKQYLFLNPRAEDAQMVRQKMIEAEIFTKSDIHFRSPIDKEVQKKKNEYNEAVPY